MGFGAAPSERTREMECKDCDGKGYIVETALSPAGVMHGEFTCLGCDGSGEAPAPKITELGWATKPKRMTDSEWAAFKAQWGR
jgi:DnaJ-class molecular chaperone